MQDIKHPVNGQAYDVEVATFDPANVTRGEALNRIAARFIEGFARGNIGVDFEAGHWCEVDAGFFDADGFGYTFIDHSVCRLGTERPCPPIQNLSAPRTWKAHALLARFEVALNCSSDFSRRYLKRFTEARISYSGSRRSLAAKDLRLPE